MNVLFLTPWYPSNDDAMAGLFVLKHVEALRAQGARVQVLHATTWRDTWHQWCALRRQGWMPDIVQLNVIQKQGLLALWLKRRYHIPYLIIEHWSGYLPENGMFAHCSSVKKRLMRRICREAEMVLPVSPALQQAMRDSGLQAKQWGLIDNVVDPFFFMNDKFTRPQNEKKILLHVSCFDERAKNIQGLLRAAKMLSDQRRDWQLVLIGTGVDYPTLRTYAQELAIPEPQLLWTGEQTPNEVAQWMHRADALVLSSRYETYGIVLAEAACARLPILSTPVGIAKQVNALIVPQEAAQYQAGLFAQFIETILWSPSATQAPDTSRFEAQTIGTKLMKIYDSCLHRHI